MSIQRLISILAIIASCHASGIGHLYPAVKSFPIVRYAPFFNFPTGARSIHAVAPPVAGPPLLPAPVSAPVLTAPAPFLPAPAPFVPAPAPLVPAPPPFYPAPAPFYPAPAPFVPAPAPFIPAPAPFLPPHAYTAPAYPAPVIAPAAPLPPPAPIFSGAFHNFAPALPKIAPYLPALPRIAPVVPALPQAALYTRAVPNLSVAPFSPIVRPVAPLPAPVFGPPAPIAVAKALPFGLPAYAPHIPYAQAPILRQAWKK